MKLKVLHVLALLGMALFASGCCTGRLYDYSKKTTRDTFLPQALYQETNGTRLAMEGMLYKDVPQEKAYAGKGVPQCLLFPDRGRWQLPAEGKQWDWLDRHNNALHEAAKDSTLQDSVPPNYQKVSDFPETLFSLPMPDSERQPHSWAMAWAPLTVTADIILSPVWIIGIGIWALSGAHPM